MPPKKISDPSAGYKPQPLSGQEIDSILERINEMSSTVHEVLSADPREADAIREKREATRKEEKLEQERKRNFNRYNPSQYKRLEDEAFIDKLLKEVDEPTPELHKRQTDLSNIETVSLREAERLKKEGNGHVGKLEFQRAFEVYGIAIGLEPEDLALNVALHNNRAMAALKIGEWRQAVEDATWVLASSGGNEPHNVKALLRRAAALVQLHRPTEAIKDCKVVLNCDSKSLEVKAILKAAQEEEKELLEYEEVFGFKTGPKAKQEEKYQVVGDMLKQNSSSTTADVEAAVRGGSVVENAAPTNITKKQKQQAELAQDIEDKAAELMSLINDLLPEKETTSPGAEEAERKEDEEVVSDEQQGENEETSRTTVGSEEDVGVVVPVYNLEKLTAVCNAVCELSAIVGSVFISGVQLRTRDHITIPKLLSLVSVAEHLLLGSGKVEEPTTTGSSSDIETTLATSLVFAAALYRLLGHIYQHQVARSTLEDKVELHKEVVASLVNISVACAGTEKPIVVPAALELLSSLCLSRKSRQLVIPALSADNMSLFVKGSSNSNGGGGNNPVRKNLLAVGGTANQAAALKLLEKLFLEPSGAAKFGSVASSGQHSNNKNSGGGGGLLSTVLTQIQSGHAGQMEAAAPMLLRLSADADFVKSMSEVRIGGTSSSSDDDGFNVLVTATKQEMHYALEHYEVTTASSKKSKGSISSNTLVKKGIQQQYKKSALVAHTRPFLLEALLAVLFNSLRSSVQAKTELSAMFCKELLHTRFYAYLEAFCLIEDDDEAKTHPRDELWNVVARMTGVMSKMTGSATSEVKEYWISNKTHGGLDPLLDTLALSCKHLQGERRLMKKAISSGRENTSVALASSVLGASDDAYKATVAENVTLILAIVTRQVNGIMALWAALGNNNVAATAGGEVSSIQHRVGLRSAQQFLGVLRFNIHTQQTGCNARTVGNAALIVPLLDAETLSPAETIADCLQSVKDLRTRSHQLDSAIGIAKEKVRSLSGKNSSSSSSSGSDDCKIEAQAELQQLEQEKVEAEAAMKNVGIALSKLAKKEAFLEQLREQRGIEILATALKP